MTITKDFKIGIGIFLLSIIVITEHLFSPKIHFGWYFILLMELSLWLIVGAAFLYTRVIERQQFFLWIYNKTYKNVFYLLSIISLFALTYVLWLVAGWLAYALFGSNDFGYFFYLRKLISANVWMLLFVTVSGSIFSVILLCGYLLPRLTHLFGSKYVAILGSALIVSLFNLGSHSFYVVLYTFLTGLLNCFYYERYKNLYVLIVCHFVFNFIISSGA